jgi:hypothetical protein
LQDEYGSKRYNDSRRSCHRFSPLWLRVTWATVQLNRLAGCTDGLYREGLKTRRGTGAPMRRTEGKCFS